MAATLLKLEAKSRFLYNLLNAIVDLLIKPIPLFVWVFIKNLELFWTGENEIQKTISLIIGVISAYMAAILFYLIYLAVVQVIKLLACTYKPIVIHFRIFDIIIKLSSKKIWNGNDDELQDLLYNHECIVAERKEKRESRKARAYERKRQSDIDELEYARKEYLKAKESAEFNRESANYNFQKAREGGTIFSSAETKRKEGISDIQRAEFDEEDARYYKEIIRAKERALGIKSEN